MKLNNEGLRSIRKDWAHVTLIYGMAVGGMLR